MLRRLVFAVLLAVTSPAVFAVPLRGGVKDWIGSGETVGGLLAVDAGSPTTVYSLGSTRPPAPRPVVWKSEDSGRTWTQLDLAGAIGPGSAIAADPNRPGTIYVGCSLSGAFFPAGGLYKTTDGGLTWKATSFPNVGVRAIAIDPAGLKTIYVAGGSFEALLGRTLGYRSRDGGLSWSEFGEDFPDSPALALLADMVIPGRLFEALVSDGALFRSLNAGASWQISNDGLANLAIRHLIQDQRTGVLYAGTNAGLFESSNGGARWDPVTSFPAVAVRALAFNLRLDALYVASNEFGVQQSFDGGGTWSPVGSGLLEVTVSRLAVSFDGSILYASTSDGVKTFDLHLPRLVAPR